MHQSLRQKQCKMKNVQKFRSVFMVHYYYSTHSIVNSPGHRCRLAPHVTVSFHFFPTVFSIHSHQRYFSDGNHFQLFSDNHYSVVSFQFLYYRAYSFSFRLLQYKQKKINTVLFIVILNCYQKFMQNMGLTNKLTADTLHSHTVPTNYIVLDC